MDSSIVSFLFGTTFHRSFVAVFFWLFFFLSVVIGDGLFLSYFLYKYALFLYKKTFSSKKMPNSWHFLV